MRIPFCFACLLLGCGPHAETGLLPEAEAVAAETVATVNGRPISMNDIATQARLSGAPPAQALDDLIAAELLATEAARRGIRPDTTPAEQEQLRAEMVRRFLATVFEREVTPETIPKRILQKGYASNTTVFYHSEYADVWHILVPVGKQATPVERKAAAVRAQAIEADARAKVPMTLPVFKAISETHGPDLRLEHIVTARDGWTLKEFSYAAHDIPKPGDVSAVVETSYGYHVIFLVRRIPAEHTSLAEATPRLKPLIFPTWQRQRFAEWTAELAAKLHVEGHAERLKRATP